MRVVSLGVNLMLSAGGTYRAVTDFQEAFDASGMEHRILNFCNVDAEAQCDAMTIISTSHRGIGRRYFWWRGSQTEQMAELLAGADLLFLHGLFIQPLLAATLWARAQGVPYVVVPHGSLDPFVFTYRSWRKRAWMRLYGRAMLRQSARILFSTEREHEKALYRQDSAETILPWPVARVPESDKESVARRIRRQLELPENQRLALYCGRLHPSKRPLETIQAFLSAAPPDWTLIVVGGSSPELSVESVRRVVEGAGHRVRVMGPVYGDSLQDYYQAAELLLLLSRKENFGYAVAEALASGTAVAISHEVDLSPHILEQRCGFVLRGSSAGDFSSDLRSILRTNQDTLRDLGSRGREWARRDLPKERFRRELVELCSSVVGVSHVLA